VQALGAPDTVMQSMPAWFTTRRKPTGRYLHFLQRNRFDPIDASGQARIGLRSWA
jgi:hypothetical protein